ncbi:YcxB family protein [Clostridium sp.]|uniref:YcxB family protein n=1 Tax=Clostridium sp. TaxID=1506 RepID=UPI001D1BCAC2|nr:YcxB family protein [Clostridium sp.]MBS5938734.1 YcxB family protein [Clostridium sp.]
MFKTNTILNEETIKELKVLAVSPKKKKFAIILYVVCSLIGLSSIVLGVILSNTSIIIDGVTTALTATIVIWAIFYVRRIFQKTNIKMIEEISKTNSIEIETIFNEDNVIINNLTTSAKIELEYDSFIRLGETSNMYVLFTGSSQQVYVSKNCLNKKEINSFKDFIKEKCKNIKW